VKKMFAATLLLIAGCGMQTRGPVETRAEGPTRIVISRGDLARGHEATRVVNEVGALWLDTRFWTSDSRGVATTDVIDLAQDGLPAEPATVADLTVSVNALTPAGSSVVVQVRTGSTFFQRGDTWTEWRAAERAIQPAGRYAQVRTILTTTDPKKRPGVVDVTLAYRVNRTPMAGKVTLASEKVQRIVASPVPFQYERQDQGDLVWLRTTFDLDDVIKDETTEFGKLRALMRWTATRKNARPKGWHAPGPYPWNIRKVIRDEDGGTIYGHCMSYCEVFITAAGAFGWQGRHWAIHGVRDTSHEVPEIWVNELGKWVFFDPSLDTYYADPETGEPLNLLDMHERYLKTVWKPNEQQRRGRTVNEGRLTRLRGKHPVKCVTGDYAYGKPTKWDWQWKHGYMTAGWLQLTPRNNWHSRPEPVHQYFGWGPDGYGGFPLWYDEQTPLPEPTEDSTPSLWYTRPRDFWWTLNQASFRLTRTGADTVRVECGNSQPFFKRYLAKRDGDFEPVEAVFTWTLTPGDNRLEVVPEDEFGKRGLASVAVIHYTPGGN